MRLTMKNWIRTHLLLAVLAGMMVGCHCQPKTAVELDQVEQMLVLKEQELSLREAAVLAAELKTTSATAPSEGLVVTAQAVGGDLGRMTFSKDGATLFYFDDGINRGQIVINGKVYLLNRQSLEVSTYVYRIGGPEVEVVTSAVKWAEEEGGDCGYGVYPTATVSLGVKTTTLRDVSLQDCSNGWVGGD
jgi:hypothetical protein